MKKKTGKMLIGVVAVLVMAAVGAAIYEMKH